MESLIVILFLLSVLTFIIFLFIGIFKKQTRPKSLYTSLCGFILSIITLTFLGAYFPKTQKASPPPTITQKPSIKKVPKIPPLIILDIEKNYYNYVDITRAVYKVTIPIDTTDAQFRAGIKKFINNECRKESEIDVVMVHAHYPSGHTSFDLPIANIIWGQNGEWAPDGVNNKDDLDKNLYRFIFQIHHDRATKFTPLK